MCRTCSLEAIGWHDGNCGDFQPRHLLQAIVLTTAFVGLVLGGITGQFGSQGWVYQTALPAVRDWMSTLTPITNGQLCLGIGILGGGLLIVLVPTIKRCIAVWNSKQPNK
jgi:hypothetical protein